MLFNSIPFIAFFPIVLLVYFIIPKKARYIWLFIASCFFYGSWNIRYSVFLAITTLLTYISGILLEKTDKAIYRKSVLIICLILNLGLLFYFKYSGFFMDNISPILARLGITVLTGADIILPVGISFYTFQATGYLVDVYRRDSKAEYNFIKYALFVSFFPTILSGPIERSKGLLVQIKNLHTVRLWDYKRITNGLFTMLWGYFLKMVVADRIAVMVDTVFDSYQSYGALEIIIATISYAIQIYCDFSSYSTIALGAARVMGIELTENFDTPYFALSVKDFWRRWHISLSSWLRDYIYIPLGGSRCSRARKYFNILVTFLCSGIWHGANWTFMIWGMLHGVYQIIGEILEPVRKRIRGWLNMDSDNFGVKAVKAIGTFILVDFAWLFFRAASFGDSLGMMKQAAGNINFLSFFNGAIYNMGLDNYELIILAVGMILLLLADTVKSKTNKNLAENVLSQNIILRWGIVSLLGIMIVVFGVYGQGYDAQSFIYFKF